METRLEIVRVRVVDSCEDRHLEKTPLEISSLTVFDGCENYLETLLEFASLKVLVNCKDAFRNSVGTCECAGV